VSICAGTARADDPLDLLPAGGLVIERPEGLSIDAEELRIGFHSVRVSYLFVNRGARDVRTKVAFAVPPFPVCTRGHGSECYFTLSFQKDANPMRFKVFVDGAAKTFETEEHVRMRGGVGKRRLTHHWSQVFPKDRPVRIAYEYVPLAGSMGTDPMDEEADRRWARFFGGEYCVPVKVVRELVKRMFGFHLVHYNLTAEPGAIRSFKLIIETRPGELVSACIPGLRRTSPTTFEVERHDFTPTNDLKVWFLDGATPGEIAAMAQAPAAPLQTPSAPSPAPAPSPQAPVVPPPGSDLSCSVQTTAITVGQSHACALVSDGSVWCWGANYVGQLGDGTTTFRSAPVPVAGLHDALAIAAGARHTCALRRLDNEVVCWGANEAGQVGRSPRPFAGLMGTIEPALKPTEVSNMVDVRAIAAGDSYTMAVKIRGAVYYWGALPEFPGQKASTRGPERVWPERGWEFKGKRPWESATRIAAGARLGCFWTREGANCFGPDLHWLGGKTEYWFDPMKLEGAKQLDPFAIGHGTVCGVDDGGALRCWGQADSVSGNARSSVTVSGLPKVARIASGGHTCAVVADGRVACWGRNPYGQLGDGTTTHQLNPVWVAGLNDAAEVAVGDTNTCVRTRDGRVLCWGENGYGQLGDGTTESRMHPTQTQFCSRAPESIFPDRVDLPGGAAGTAADRGVTALAMSWRLPRVLRARVRGRQRDLPRRHIRPRARRPQDPSQGGRVASPTRCVPRR
jgi:hypothetical protein